MDKVKIKRVNRNKKKITGKEKLLTGLGVGSALLGGMAGIGGQKQEQKPVVRTQKQGQTSKTGKIKEGLKRIFGVQEAKASYEGSDTIQDTRTGEVMSTTDPMQNAEFRWLQSHGFQPFSGGDIPSYAITQMQEDFATDPYWKNVYGSSDRSSYLSVPVSHLPIIRAPKDLIPDGYNPTGAPTRDTFYDQYQASQNSQQQDWQNGVNNIPLTPTQINPDLLPPVPTSYTPDLELPPVLPTVPDNYDPLAGLSPEAQNIITGNVNNPPDNISVTGWGAGTINTNIEGLGNPVNTNGNSQANTPPQAQNQEDIEDVSGTQSPGDMPVTDNVNDYNQVLSENQVPPSPSVLDLGEPPAIAPQVPVVPDSLSPLLSADSITPNLETPPIIAPTVPTQFSQEVQNIINPNPTITTPSGATIDLVTYQNILNDPILAQSYGYAVAPVLDAPPEIPPVAPNVAMPQLQEQEAPSVVVTETFVPVEPIPVTSQELYETSQRPGNQEFLVDYAQAPFPGENEGRVGTLGVNPALPPVAPAELVPSQLPANLETNVASPAGPSQVENEYTLGSNIPNAVPFFGVEDSVAVPSPQAQEFAAPSQVHPPLRFVVPPTPASQPVILDAPDDSLTRAVSQASNPNSSPEILTFLNPTFYVPVMQGGKQADGLFMNSSDGKVYKADSQGNMQAAANSLPAQAVTDVKAAAQKVGDTLGLTDSAKLSKAVSQTREALQKSGIATFVDQKGNIHVQVGLEGNLVVMTPQQFVLQVQTTDKSGATFGNAAKSVFNVGLVLANPAVGGAKILYDTTKGTPQTSIKLDTNQPVIFVDNKQHLSMSLNGDTVVVRDLSGNTTYQYGKDQVVIMLDYLTNAGVLTPNYQLNLQPDSGKDRILQGMGSMLPVFGNKSSTNNQVIQVLAAWAYSNPDSKP